jgi:preprotein translocase subunit SecG
MNWLQTLAVVFHVLLAVGIIGLVLLQRGRGADAGAGFGAGASGTVFGARGSASFLSRSTAVLATLFFVSSLVLSYLFSHATAPTSVMDRVATEQPQPAGGAPASGVPTTPAPSAPAPATQDAPAAPAPAPTGQ